MRLYEVQAFDHVDGDLLATYVVEWSPAVDSAGFREIVDRMVRYDTTDGEREAVRVEVAEYRPFRVDRCVLDGSPRLLGAMSRFVDGWTLAVQA